MLHTFCLEIDLPEATSYFSHMHKMVLFYVTSTSACGRREATRTRDIRVPSVMPYLMDFPGINQSLLRLGGSNSVATFHLVQVFVFPRYTIRISSHLISLLDVYSFYHALILQWAQSLQIACYCIQSIYSILSISPRRLISSSNIYLWKRQIFWWVFEDTIVVLSEIRVVQRYIANNSDLRWS